MRELENPPKDQDEMEKILAATTPSTFAQVIRETARRGYCRLEKDLLYSC